MATYFAALGSKYRLELYADEDTGSISIPGNTSEVDGALYIRKLSGSGYWTYSNDSFSGNTGGAFSGVFTYDFRSYSLLLLWSGTFVVGHNADGSKTLSVSGTFNDVLGQLGAGTAAGSLTLSTIPRASNVTFAVAGSTVTSADAGVEVTLNTNRASSGFTHEMSYAFGGLTAQPIASGVGASTAFTFPLALLNEMPNATSGPLTVTTKTYNGATLIGTTTKVLTLGVPAGAAFEPDFGTITHAETVTAVGTAIGGYVQGFTKLALAITSATAPYSATVASYKITVGAQTINAQAGTTPDPIGVSGSVALVGTVTDSRGRTHSETVTVTVLAYSLPAMSAAQFRRSLSGGTVDENGTYIRADLTAAAQSLTVAAVEKNALTINAFTRVRGTTDWGTAVHTETPGAIAYANHFEFGVYSVGTSYDLQLILSDVLGGVLYINATITTAGVFIHFAGAGQGMAVGKYWEQGSIDAKGQIYQNDGKAVADSATLALLIPSGSTMDFAGAVEPAGWLFCDGRSLLRSAYPALFAALGTAHGAADVSHFNIPNKRGRVSVGFDSTQTEFDTLGETGGAKAHTHSLTQAVAAVWVGFWKSRGGTVPVWTATNSGGITAPGGSSSTATAGASIEGLTDSTSNLPPYIVLNSIIKI